MNRRFFAHSWGRKIFFGLSWPITAILFLVYLQSFLLPQGVASWLYFISTSIALSGLFNSIAYFCLYYPVTILLPGYYAARFWSLLLILVVNGGILLDALIFGQFRFHINALIIRNVSERGINDLFPNSPILMVVPIALVSIAVIVWIRGEKLWRTMQKRFSNPVSNWYLFLIVGFLALSHFLYKSEGFQRFGHNQTLASLFPLNYQTLMAPPGSGINSTAFHYPKEKVSCPGKNNPHIIFIVAEGWTTPEFSAELTPFLYHLPDHGTLFESHYYLARHPHDGLFGLLYGIPAIHRGVAQKQNPAFINELKKRGYELFLRTNFEDMRKFADLQPMHGSPVQNWVEWKQDKKGPFFVLLEFKGNDFTGVDNDIRAFLNNWHEEGLLNSTLIVATGSHSPEAKNMPLMVIWPNRRKGEWSHKTTHYDVAPTLMQEIWNCKMKYSSVSEGKSLFLAPEREWQIFGNEFEFLILDQQDNSVFKAKWDGEISSEVTPAQEELYLKILRHSLRFYKN